MSRPVSRASRKGSAKKKKEKPKPPKVIIKELTEQNEMLNQELTVLRTESLDLREKVDTLVKKIIDNVNKKDFGIPIHADIFQIKTDVIMEMLGKLIVKKRLQEISVDARVDDLEERVTDMSLDLAKLTKKTMAYEMGLEDIAACDNLEQVKDRVYELQLIAGQEFHTFRSLSPVTNPTPVQTPEPMVNGVNGMNGFIDIPDSATQLTLQHANKLNLIPPTRKLAGETLVRNMHQELRLYIMQELSQEKASGADWRMLAQRVGVERDTIEHWKGLSLRYPMGRVLAHWQESPGATVRMLHRHLMSPQLRCTILGKRVADFYNVD